MWEKEKRGGFLGGNGLNFENGRRRRFVEENVGPKVRQMRLRTNLYTYTKHKSTNTDKTGKTDANVSIPIPHHSFPKVQYPPICRSHLPVPNATAFTLSTFAILPRANSANLALLFCQLSNPLGRIQTQTIRQHFWGCVGNLICFSCQVWFISQSGGKSKESPKGGGEEGRRKD
jgi:hypothetical protein